MTELVSIVEQEPVQIVCPDCGAIEQAYAVLYEGTPFWTYIHECTNCGYIISESEWEEL